MGRDRRRVEVRSNDVDRLTIRLNDEMAGLDKPVSITSGHKPLFEGTVARTVAALAETRHERRDPQAMFSGEVTVPLRAATNSD